MMNRTGCLLAGRPPAEPTSISSRGSSLPQVPPHNAMPLTVWDLLQLVMLQKCCIKHFVPTWASDSGCLSADRLTRVGKKRFGDAWSRLSSCRRPSRPGCDCSRYCDLSNVKGHKKCGSQEAACIYCTASCERFGIATRDRTKREIEAFCSGEREDCYQHLLTTAREEGDATKLSSC
jgi:hypothetical protein